MQLHTWSEGIQFDKVIYNWPVTKFLTNVDKGRKWHHDVASAHFYRCADSSIFWLARMTSICLDVTYIPATMSEGTSFGDWSIDYIIKNDLLLCHTCTGLIYSLEFCCVRGRRVFICLSNWFENWALFGLAIRLYSMCYKCSASKKTKLTRHFTISGQRGTKRRVESDVSNTLL